jgi:hypothetical protein
MANRLPCVAPAPDRPRRSRQPSKKALEGQGAKVIRVGQPTRASFVPRRHGQPLSAAKLGAKRRRRDDNSDADWRSSDGEEEESEEGPEKSEDFEEEEDEEEAEEEEAGVGASRPRRPQQRSSAAALASSAPGHGGRRQRAQPEGQGQEQQQLEVAGWVTAQAAWVQGHGCCLLCVGVGTFKFGRVMSLRKNTALQA